MSGKNVDVMVPSLGESVTEATVATWFKKPGDTVAMDEMLCEPDETILEWRRLASRHGRGIQQKTDLR